jgi:hypothetical protein
LGKAFDQPLADPDIRALSIPLAVVGDRAVREADDRARIEHEEALADGRHEIPRVNFEHEQRLLRTFR